jgi:hypothetical protein
MNTTINPERLERFEAAYRDALRDAVTSKPQDYMIGGRLAHGKLERFDETPEQYAERTATTMIDAIVNMRAVSFDGCGFRRACKALGIRPSRVSIYEFLRGGIARDSSPIYDPAINPFAR